MHLDVSTVFPVNIMENTVQPRNDPQPLKDPQIDPEMIPIFLLVDLEMILKELGNGN